MSKFVIIEVANLNYALPIEKIFSIERLIEITEIPCTADYFRGIVSVRESINPVYDLGLILNSQKTERNDESRLILVDIKGKTVALLVNQAKEIVEYTDADIKELNSVVKADYLIGAISKEEGLISVINLEMLFEALVKLEDVESFALENL